jgi:hypothetical protein
MYKAVFRKRYFSLTFLFSAAFSGVMLIGFGCQTVNDCVSGNRKVVRQEISVAEFDALVLETGAEVYLRQDSSADTGAIITVEAESNILPELQSKVQNRTLFLRRNRCYTTGKGVKYFITTRRLNSLTLNGSGNIYWPGYKSAFPLTCVLAGSGNIDLNYNGPSLNARLSGSGDITISGEAPLQEIHISGSGNVSAFRFLTQESSVFILGSGNAQVRCERVLNANIEGSGNIIYQGNPTVNSRVAGSGRVIRL